MRKRNIIIGYIFLGLLWIVLSDIFVDRFIPLEMVMTVQKIKGTVYVVLSAGIIYFLIGKFEELNNSKEQEERLSTLINSMVDFVCFKDGQGRWLEVNNFGLKLFQLEKVEYRGKTDLELSKYTDFYREALIYCNESDEKTWKNGEVTRYEEVVQMNDGTKKFFDMIKVPLFHEDGTRKGLVVIGRDITERKLTDEHIRKTDKLSIVGELAASVGHEIRNPLTSIKGFVQLLQENEHENQFYYEIMSKELDRIDHIVGELLLLAKPQKIHFSLYDLREIMNDIVCLLETQANMNNVILHFNRREELIIACQKNQLKQVFLNILKNALEASEPQGNVWIKLEEDREKILVTIKDEGCGIPKLFMEKIGEPFYSSKEKGTGLGLTVSHKIIQQHEGQINITSKEGVGTKVEIQLPINQSEHMS